jgi:hypothetical protein
MVTRSSPNNMTTEVSEIDSTFHGVSPTTSPAPTTYNFPFQTSVAWFAPSTEAILCKNRVLAGTLGTTTVETAPPVVPAAVAAPPVVPAAVATSPVVPAAGVAEATAADVAAVSDAGKLTVGAKMLGR